VYIQFYREEVSFEKPVKGCERGGFWEKGVKMKRLRGEKAPLSIQKNRSREIY